MDSNGPMLECLAKECGVDVAARKNVPDDCDQLIASIRDTATKVDMLLFSGGVSAGDFDFVPSALADSGFTIHFDCVAMKPGKPLTFATSNNCVAFGLPGNPVSVFTGFYFFVRRAIHLLNGVSEDEYPLYVPLQTELEMKDMDRMVFLPAEINSCRDGRIDFVSWIGSSFGFIGS